MERLLDYVNHHPWLAGALVLVLIIVALYELHARRETLASVSAAVASPARAAEIAVEAAIAAPMSKALVSWVLRRSSAVRRLARDR